MATTTMPRPRADPLWAQAAELERQFEGYKRRLAERAAAAVAAVHPDSDVVGGEREAKEEELEVGRGRRYEAYVRRRDEKLRQGWLARMERKEAEVKALWARLDRDRHRHRSDVGLAATATATASPAREQKARNMEKPAASPATPRCISAMKLPRLRSATASASPSPAAPSPRLPSTRRASHPEPPTTPRKENRVPPPSTAASPRPLLKTLSRTRSSLKEERGSVSSSSSSSVRGESPRPPRFQPPRSSYDGGAGGVKANQAAAPALRSDADAAVAAARSRFHEQVVLAEIKTAAAVSPDPFRLRRSRNGVARASSPLLASGGQGHVDFLTRLGNGDPNDVGTSERSEAGAKNSDKKADGEVARSGDKLGDAEITGDSDTEPSYVYVKKDHEEVGEEEAAEIFEDTMASSPSSETMASSPSSEAMASSSEGTGTSAKESPTTGAEASSLVSSGSLYSNVQSSFSHESELDASAAGSPLPTQPPSGGALSTEELLEADAAMLRMKREEEGEMEDADEQSIVFLPSTCCTSRSACGDVPAAGMPQPPMDAVAGLKRFLTFGKKNGKGADDAAVTIERAPPPAGDAGASQGPASGDPIINKPRTCWSDAASDDLDSSSYVLSPHVRSLQSFVPAPSPATPHLKETALAAKSPRVHRSFFSFSSFKNKGN